jgi:hypothetical protein
MDFSSQRPDMLISFYGTKLIFKSPAWDSVALTPFLSNRFNISIRQLHISEQFRSTY